jgi:hypothetical protein
MKNKVRYTEAGGLYRKYTNDETVKVLLVATAKNAVGGN